MTAPDAAAPGVAAPGAVRVLYLAGSGRSGSTLLTTILGQLAGFFAAGELRYLWQRGVLENRPCGCGLPVNDCPFWSAVRRELPADNAAGIADRLRTRLRLRGLPALLRRHRRGRPAVAGHPDDRVIADLYAALARHAALAEAPGPARHSGPAGGSGPARHSGPAGAPGAARHPGPAEGSGPTAGLADAPGPVIVDSSKLPPYGALLGTLPGIDLRVLHLVRDPRGTAFSWRRRRGLDGRGDGRLMSRPPVWKAALLWLVWNGAAGRLWARGDSGRYLRIRYEDFVADPERVIRRIAGFAGMSPARLPFTPAGQVLLAPTHSVAGNPSRHRVGPVPITDDDEWIWAMPTWSYALVTLISVPLLRRLGYPLRRPGPMRSDRHPGRMRADRYEED